MARPLIIVKAARDPDAGVWFVESSDVPGLNVEADTLDDMVEKLPGAIQDLLEDGAFGDDFDAGQDVPVELITAPSTRVRLLGAA